MAFEAVEGWVDAGGIKTHYYSAGEGKDVVILLHGGGGGAYALHNWAPTIPGLANGGFTVYAPDVVGFGLTDKPEGWHTFDKKVEHLKNFLDALSIDRVHLIGNSMGAGISCGFITQYPDRVGKLICMGGGAAKLGDLSPALKSVKNFTPDRERMRKLLESLTCNPELVTDEMVENRYQMAILPGAQESNSAFLGELPFEEFIDRTEKKLATIPHEVLLAWGEEDIVVPMKVADRMMEIIPNCRLELFPNCGHWVQLEDIDRFNKLAIDFFSAK